MKYKILFLLIPISVLILSITKISLAEVKISDVPTPAPEKIQNFIPQPLTELFKIFSNINIDFSKLPFINRVVRSIPRSGEEVASSFRWLTQGLGDLNNWVNARIGLNILFVIQKVGEFFVWIFQGIADLIKIGLSFIQ